jgi:hypothetical protein
LASWDFPQRVDGAARFKVQIHRKKPGQMTGLLTFENGEAIFTRLRMA